MSFPYPIYAFMTYDHKVLAIVGHPLAIRAPPRSTYVALTIDVYPCKWVAYLAIVTKSTSFAEMDNVEVAVFFLNVSLYGGSHMIQSHAI